MSATNIASSLIAGLMVASVGAAFSQDYPVKPIRIVTAAAGGGNDFIARQIGPVMSASMGQPIVVDNRAQGLIAAEVVSKAVPDGYVLAMVGSTFWTSSLLRKVPYDPINDFAPVSLLERLVHMVVVHPSLPAKSIKELIAVAKANPGKLNYATSAGVGSTSHLATELFSHMAGIKLIHVPYKGNAPALTGLMSGEVQLMISDAGVAKPYVDSRRLKALAVTTSQPSALAPGLPTVAESGLPGYEAVGLTALFAPAKTSDAIVRRLNQETVRVLSMPDIKEKFLTHGTEASSSTPEQLAARIKSETTQMAKVIKDAGIKAE